jgi:hypothetical protein
MGMYISEDTFNRTMIWQKESSCGQMPVLLEIHNTLENFFAFRIRARDEVVGVKKIEGVDAQHAPLLCEVD